MKINCVYHYVFISLSYSQQDIHCWWKLLVYVGPSYKSGTIKYSHKGTLPPLSRLKLCKNISLRAYLLVMCTQILLEMKGWNLCLPSKFFDWLNDIPFVDICLRSRGLISRGLAIVEGLVWNLEFISGRNRVVSRLLGWINGLLFFINIPNLVFLTKFLNH
jgi:hypothetical protein